MRLIQEARDRAHDACEYCLLPQRSQEATFHIDHIVPRREGGETDVVNLAFACVTCSLRKGARMFAIDPQSQWTVRLFHPREETWSEHFRLNDEFEFEGLSPTGRATIVAMGMNRPAIVSIRKELHLLGRFPPNYLE
ncbi:HNH endonuclease [Pirellulaceae bacterium SH449]